MPKRTCDCGECQKCRRREYQRAYYRENTELVRAINKRSRAKRLEAVRAYDRARSAAKKKTEYGLLRFRAMNAVWRAVEKGQLIPLPCEVCGLPPFMEKSKRQVEAHHEDYTKPLEVHWLCHTHHMAQHRSVAP